MSAEAISSCVFIWLIGCFMASMFWADGSIDGDTVLMWPIAVAKRVILAFVRILITGRKL